MKIDLQKNLADKGVEDLRKFYGNTNYDLSKRHLSLEEIIPYPIKEISERVVTGIGLT